MKKLIIFLLILITQSCDESMENLKVISDSENIELLLLSADEYEVNKKNRQYIESKEVIDTFRLEKEMKKRLTKALLSKENYEPLSRKCKLDPVYALKIDGKLFAIFDVEFCPLLELRIEDSNKKELLQLVFDNSIKKVINEIIKNKKT